MENKQLITVIGKDLYNIIRALDEKYITDTMEALVIEVFDLDDRSGQQLDCSMEELIEIMEELKPNLDKIPDHPYYRASFNRIKELCTYGYDRAEAIYAEKLDAVNDNVLGTTPEEFANDMELLKKAIPDFSF